MVEETRREWAFTWADVDAACPGGMDMLPALLAMQGASIPPETIAQIRAFVASRPRVRVTLATDGAHLSVTVA